MGTLCAYMVVKQKDQSFSNLIFLTECQERTVQNNYKLLLLIEEWKLVYALSHCQRLFAQEKLNGNNKLG